MPWTIQMVQDCIDPFTGSLTHWPWPQKSWLFNAAPLQAMNLSLKVFRLLTKSTDEWTKEDDDLYKWIQENK